MIKNYIKLIFELFFILIMLICLCGNKLLIYGISQAKGQLTIIIHSQPVEEILQDELFVDSLKQKLRLIVELKQFVIDSIGINPSDNYSTFYNQRNKPILYTITACQPYSFIPKEWNFPFLGAVPYKGFFNKKEAEKEVLSLKIQGYDVDLYSPSGWSTLGWLNDPILSNMLYKSEGQLANLIIHELTHGTIYIKNNVTFNENLANFIGDKGAENFLQYKFGLESKQYIYYKQSKMDEKCFTDYMIKSKKQLDSLYHSMSAMNEDTLKNTLKNKLIMEIVLGVNRLPLFKKKNYFQYSLIAFVEKNSFFMAFDRYDSQFEVFDIEYRSIFKSNLRNYFNFLKEKFN